MRMPEFNHLFNLVKTGIASLEAKERCQHINGLELKIGQTGSNEFFNSITRKDKSLSTDGCQNNFAT